MNHGTNRNSRRNTVETLPSGRRLVGLGGLLLVALLCARPLAADPNKPVSLGHLSTHNRTIRDVLEVRDNADAYWFFVSGSHTRVFIQVTGEPGMIGRVSLYEDRARRWTDYAGAATVRFEKILNSGWHYVRIDSGSTTTNVPYRLVVSGASHGNYPDAGDDFNRAHQMKFRASSSTFHYALARDRVHSSDRIDVFEFDLPFAYNDLRVYTMESYGGGAYLELLDSRMNLYAQGKNLDLPGTHSLESVLPGGKYYVRVTMDSVTRSSDRFTTSFGTGYALYLTAESAPGDQAGNDFVHELNLGSIGNPINFRDFLARDKGDPVDAFRFQVNARAQVAIGVENQRVRGLPAGDADVWLGDANYRTVWSGYSAGNEGTVLNLAPGSYHLLVTHQPTGRANTPVETSDMLYRLSLTVVPPAVTDIGANTPALAFYGLPSEIIYPGVTSFYTPHTESIGGTDTADYFRVTVQGRPQQQMVGFHAEVTPPQPGNLTLEVWERGPTGPVLVAARVQAVGGVVTLDAGLAPGNYIVGVVNQSGAASTYTLTLQTRW